MKIFGTGLSGYIGTNLIRHLQEIYCGYVNYDRVLGYDIMNVEAMIEKMDGCDVVVHLAALPNIQYCEQNPSEAIKINIIGTDRVITAASHHDLLVVFPSTFAAKNPQNVYGLTKRLAEHLVLSSNGVVLRLANIYGGIGYLKLKQSALSNFVQAKQKGEKATIYGDGSAERDFIHIDDVCLAIINGLSAPPGIYEVCTGKQTSILELAKLIGVEYGFAPTRKGEVKKVPSSPEYEMPGWRSRLGLEEGLRRMLK